MAKLAWRVGAATALMAVVLSGCTSVLQGTALRDPGNTEDTVRSALQPGNYPTQPRPALGNAGPKGNLVEARRMGEVLVLPFDVDPELTKSGGMGNGVIKDANATIKAFPEPLPAGADHNFIAGVTMVADNQGAQEKSLQNTLLRFATPEDATAALEDMFGRTAAMKSQFSGDAIDGSPASIQRHPDAKAVTWFSGSNTGMPLVLSLIARGPFVLAQLTISNRGLDAATELVAATLDKQLPALDGFTPTPVDKLADLPLDSDGLLARTLAPPPDQSLVYHGVWGPHGSLMFMMDPLTTQKVFTETGVDAVAILGGTTYRAKDAQAAQTLVGKLAEIVQADNYQLADPVPGLPNSQCLSYQPEASSYEVGRTYCVAAADRVAFETFAGQETDAHQKMAAQYLMLTAK